MQLFVISSAFFFTKSHHFLSGWTWLVPTNVERIMLVRMALDFSSFPLIFL